MKAVEEEEYSKVKENVEQEMSFSRMKIPRFQFCHQFLFGPVRHLLFVAFSPSSTSDPAPPIHSFLPSFLFFFLPYFLSPSLLPSLLASLLPSSLPSSLPAGQSNLI